MTFPADTFAFLSGIAAHNDKAWFEANRGLYEAGYVAPAKAFVAALGPRLAERVPGIRFDARINGSLTRINRDIRFSKDKRPYKDHLDLWFWHGETRSWQVPGFWFRLTPAAVQLGAGMYGFSPDQLEAFRQSVIHPRSGKALLALSESLAAAGYAVGGKSRKRPPAGFATDPDRADFLLYEGLHAGITLPADAARHADFIDIVLGHFAATAPLNAWLLAEVVD